MKKHLLYIASFLCLTLAMPFIAQAYDGDMVQAVKENNERRVKNLLHRGVNPNTTDEFGDRPLIAAARHNNAYMVKLLLANGAHVNKRGRLHETALIIAASKGSKPIVKILLDHRADVNIKDQRGKTARNYAAERGYHEIVRMLGGGHAQADDSDLLHAASNGNTERVARLLERGLRINRQDSRGFTALMYAANNGHLETVKYLLRHGANANIRDRHGKNARYYAERSGHHRIVRVLENHTGHVSSSQRNDPTSIRIFMDAARTGNIPVAQAHLRAKRVDINVRNNRGKTALDVAMEHGQKEMVRFLINHGAR